MTDASSEETGSATVDEEFGAIEEFVTDVQESADDYIARLLSEDRSRIAKLIVWLFLIACLGTLGFIVVSVLWSVGGWEIGAERMATILSSVILPVVTLVIGYYFGTETRQK
ncbi:MAG: hypothetical protein ACE5GS_16080 [Kiloniellaceae bacterium]